MKKITLSLLCVILMLCLFSCSSNRGKMIAEQVNKMQGLPKVIANGIYMEKAEAISNKEIQFVCKLPAKITNNGNPENFIKNSKPALIQLLEVTQENKLYIENNITVSYVYKREDGSEYAIITISPDEYIK